MHGNSSPDCWGETSTKSMCLPGEQHVSTNSIFFLNLNIAIIIDTTFTALALACVKHWCDNNFSRCGDGLRVIQGVVGSKTQYPIFLHLPAASCLVTQRYVAVHNLTFLLPMIMSLNCKQFCKNLLVRYLHQDINVHLGPAVLGFAHVLRHQHLRIPKSALGASLTWSGACSYTPSRIPWWHI